MVPDDGSSPVPVSEPVSTTELLQFMNITQDQFGIHRCIAEASSDLFGTRQSIVDMVISSKIPLLVS